MKANELMIGDWVSYKNGFSDGEMTINTVVGTISEKYITEFVWGKRIDCEHLYPIPLTAEILKKNGFEKVQIHGEKQDDIFQCFDKEIIIEVGIYDPNFILIRYHYETPDGINSGELSSIIKVDGGMFYLHELQHALRLCGIEKEIEL